MNISVSQQSDQITQKLGQTTATSHTLLLAGSWLGDKPILLRIRMVSSDSIAMEVTVRGHDAEINVRVAGCVA